MQKKLFQQILFFTFSCIFISCSLQATAKTDDVPSWFLQPKQNDSSSLYGVGQGFTLEEATKSALADAAARMTVSISSESTMLREENQNSVNEETRQKIKQNIEKIDFVNFQTSRSQKFDAQIYVEVQIPRDQFISAQKDKLGFLDRQILDLQKNLPVQNMIQKRNSLLKISDLAKQGEIVARILESNGSKGGVKEKLALIAQTQNELNKLSDKVEFYFDIKSPGEIASIIRNALNKEKIKITKTQSNVANQVQIAIHSQKTNGEVYGAFITKIKIDFENKSVGKVVASNSIEVSGSSTISEKESYAAALESLKERIAQDGILKILGII